MTSVKLDNYSCFLNYICKGNITKTTSHALHRVWRYQSENNTNELKISRTQQESKPYARPQIPTMSAQKATRRHVTTREETHRRPWRTLQQDMTLKKQHALKNAILDAFVSSVVACDYLY